METIQTFYKVTYIRLRKVILGGILLQLCERFYATIAISLLGKEKRKGVLLIRERYRLI